MHISQLYTYPIKSLRPVAVNEAELTRHGFRYDRRFMLLQHDEKDGKRKYKNMQVVKYNEMVLFHTSLKWPSNSDGSDGVITVHFKPPQGEGRRIYIPLCPDINGADTLEVDLYSSKVKSYVMPATVNSWFSECFGYEATLVYLGPSLRPVYMSTLSETLPSHTSWLGRAAALTGLSQQPEATEHITFADLAPYLVVSERSMDDVDSRLPEGEKVDITKFRPNIVVSGAEKPYDEDYWSELVFNEDTKLACVHNCTRCKSINVDFATGKQGTSEAGKILSKLQKDRRLDKGMKYSPIFGRYAFLPSSCVGHTIRVGDPVKVARVNTERTTMDWKGLATSASTQSA